MDKTYIVIELQTNSNGTIGSLTYSFADINTAENKYHTILAAAAVSNLPCHAAVMIQNDGLILKADRYYHNTEE